MRRLDLSLPPAQSRGLALPFFVGVGPEAAPVAVTDADGEKQGSSPTRPEKKVASPLAECRYGFQVLTGSRAQERTGRMNSIGCRDTVGIDLGDAYSYVCVLDPQGRVARRFRHATTPKAFRAHHEHRESSLVVIETGTHSPWISRLLAECGHEVIVANARRVALISRGKKKTDREDCEALARLGRIDPEFLSPIEHRGEESQLDMTALRARSAAIRARTQLINAVRGLVKPCGERIPKCGSATFHKTARKHMPPQLKESLEPLLVLIEASTTLIKAYDEQVKALCAKHKPTQLLQAVPGVGPIASLTFVLTLEDPRRFRRSRQVGAYLGLTPRLSESGDSKPQLRITKAGDVDLRTLLVTSAQYILGPWGPDSDLRRCGLALAERGARNGKKRAVVAVARRLAVLLHHLWKTGEVYDPLHLARRRGEADDPTKMRLPRARGKSKKEQLLASSS